MIFAVCVVLALLFQIAGLALIGQGTISIGIWPVAGLVLNMVGGVVISSLLNIAKEDSEDVDTA